jgi:methylaspartate ammonia-lyase
MIPGAQAVCTFSADGFVTAYPGTPASAPATISVPATGANVKITFSSEAMVDTVGDILAVSYSIDGGAPTIFGPEFFASNTSNFEAHTHTDIVVGLPGGTHTIQPYAYILGTGTGTLFFRCLTVEGSTM